MAAADIKLPDFALLVNFPEHLTRGQTRGTGDCKGLAPEGKRHCVMCGQLRICSSSANRLNRSTAASSPPPPHETHNPTNDATITATAASSSSSSAVHIIPRQNKGVCTACDVTVWTVLAHPNTPGISNTTTSTTTSPTLEIKWCKGCKNFRPWPAFGDKGLATKCARCRHRQREKYALQKKQTPTTAINSSSGGRDGVRPPPESSSLSPYHHYTTTTTSPSAATIRHSQKDDDLLAAQGLSNLMRAQNV